jgi:hypothetical protein
MKATDIDILYTTDINTMQVILTTNRNPEYQQKIFKLKELTEEGKLLAVDIKQYRKRRSLDANAYCWILSQKIAEKIGNTKEYVYKKAIREVGQFEIVPIRNDAVERWIKNWESKGLGWQSIVMGESKLEGYTNTINYFGSSVYNTKEMSLLLEELVYQAKELGIDTMTDTEKRELLDMWENKGH